MRIYECCLDGHLDGWEDECMERWMDGCVYWWMACTHGDMHACINVRLVGSLDEGLDMDEQVGAWSV